MTNVLTIVLGGGKGTRLYPLTMNRAKPAVPFGAKYRLVDIPLSNSINSGFKRIYVLTQFNSASLHLHINHTYNFDTFTRGFVEILAAEQTFASESGWYEGTGDAVRKNFVHFHTQQPEQYLILSGDQLYRMDLVDFFHNHVDSGCDVTIATTPVTREEAVGLGIMTVDGAGRITEFREKPPLSEDISHMRVPEHLHPNPEALKQGKEYLASMGIYFFKASALERALNNEKTDFGKEIIPMLIDTVPSNAYVYQGYWEDIGTIKNFYETNLDLAAVQPAFNFYDEHAPIFTHKRDLPASKFNRCSLNNALAADGCIISDATIARSLIGIRSIIHEGVSLDGVFTMGADHYESPEELAQNRELGRPDIGIGPGSSVSRAILDKNARVGANCRIGVDGDYSQPHDDPNYYVRDGIIIVPKNATIADGTVI